VILVFVVERWLTPRVIADVGRRVAHEEPDIAETGRHEMGL
jgi:hypothetical protein